VRNKKTASEFGTRIRVIIGLLISIFIIACSVATTLVIMYLKEQMKTQKYSTFLLLSVPPVLTIISAQFYNLVYGKVSKFLNNYENHWSVTEFEGSLIFKVFIFNFVNEFNAFLIIAFLKDYRVLNNDKDDIFGECPIIDTDFVVSSIDGE